MNIRSPNETVKSYRCFFITFKLRRLFLFYVEFLRCSRVGEWICLHVRGHSDFDYISSNDRMLISNHVVDFKKVDDFVVGVQLSRCPNTDPQKIILSDQPKYFILNIETRSIKYYETKSDFNHDILELKISKKVNLNHIYVNNRISAIQKKHKSFINNGRMERCYMEINEKIMLNSIKYDWYKEMQSMKST